MARRKKSVHRKSPAGRPYKDSGRGINPNNYPFSHGHPAEREADEDYLPRAKHGVERRLVHYPMKGKRI